MNLHPIFGDIVAAHFPALSDKHRGWSLSFDFPPIPVRDFDWSATSPDYDCDCDDEGFHATSGAVVHGPTRAAVIAEIDAWYLDQEPTPC